MKKCTLKNISFTNDNSTIEYDYELSKDIQKYFNKENPYYVTYEKEISNTPSSIAVIPFLANIMPIAWFAGFDVVVDEVDEIFFNSLTELKKEFTKYHPNKTIKGELISKKLVKNIISGTETALLFSGGLDSFESYTRNYESNPYLISIHGADVEINDHKRWEDFKRYNTEEEIVANDKLCYISTNVRDFYTYKVDLLVNIGWWGKIQHGMSLLGVIAPLGYQLGISKILIGSSNTEEVDFGWGSSPNIDEKMKWSNSTVIHDGYHLRRTDKIDNIVAFTKNNHTPIKLRVCYSELRDGYNCSICAKCQRTIFGLLLANSNPNDYGFKVPANIYSLLLNNFKANTVMSTGVKYEWKCLQKKASEITDFFVLNNKETEKQSIQTFINLDLESLVNVDLEKTKPIFKLKFILRHKFRNAYKTYKKIRYN
ncbi:hypothetical protein M4I21_03100 [Cellulophaga sp. 20_2_10]|uniref:hypothetical protein n=1 Tax=Cellulophaga sp. 20_2_10 TaxID=2942476 RepID=UPI00201AC96A|nr:hypothetical protein [Cellulophaga sp. 20_2_10]MCL5244780.1 hypothetical protein [Cellulophaga sp. 20_2_10]